MKAYYLISLFCCLLLVNNYGFAQEETTAAVADTEPAGKQEQVFTYVEEMPEPGTDILQFLGRHLKYPEEAKSSGIEGKVTVKFIIDTAGLMHDIQIVRGISPLLDSESIRVVKLLPAWKPGRQNGQPVNVSYMLPVFFSLDDHELMELVTPREGKRHAYVSKRPYPSFDLDSFIYNLLQYPVSEKENGIGGEVIIKVQINEDGTVSNPMIAGSVYPSLDEEALRLVAKMPAWTPAYLNYKPVSVFVPVKVNFRLNKNEIVSKSDPIQPILTLANEMPEPGFDINGFLQKNLVYPKQAKEHNIEGRLIVQFVVDTDGKIIHVHTPKPVNVFLDREARRVVEKMPRWKPARLNNVPVKVYYTLPISFRLE